MKASKEELLKIAERLKELLDLMGFDRKEFATAMNVDATTVSNWFLGKRELKGEYLDDLVLLYSKKTGKTLSKSWFKKGMGERDITISPLAQVSTQKDESMLYTIIKDLMQKNDRLMDIIEGYIQNPNFPEDSSLVPTHRLGWTTIQPAA